MSGSPEEKTSEAVVERAETEDTAQRGSKESLEKIRQSLLLKRAELVKHRETQLDALYTPDKHHLADLDEMSSDTVDTDSLCALVDIGSHTVEQIDAALERIEEGSYGTCETCSKPIPWERLEVLPFAALCINCQRDAEENGKSGED